MMRTRHHTSLAVAAAVVLHGAALLADGRDRPAEEIRLSAKTFRDGLKSRGLTELLDLHLKDFPPSDEVTALLMRRDLKLSEYAESARPMPARRQALADANRLLGEAIAAAPDDPRRFEWMFELGRSLIYDEAEPYSSSILYRTGSSEDRDALLSLSTRAFAVMDELVEALVAEYARVDKLSVREFERMERSGRIEQLDALMPRAEYLRAWCCFYDALPRSEGDVVRATRLKQLRAYFSEYPAVLETPHEQSRVQVQAYLLAGMAHRLSGYHDEARLQLAKAISIANRLVDEKAVEAVRWAVTLARIESVRNDADAGEFGRAFDVLTRFRTYAHESAPDSRFGLELVAALLERDLYRRQAADKATSPAERERLHQRASGAMLDLIKAHPDRRDDIYAAVYRKLERVGRLEDLDPFETAAFVGGLLAGAGDGDQSERLERAVTVGRRFVEQAPPGAAPLLPEVLYNVGVAAYRLDRVPEAAATFLQVVERFPTFENARQAAVFAVQLSREAAEQRGAAAAIRSLHRQALELLLEHYPESEDARYWRFYYAQLLETAGEYRKAGSQYGQVHAGHEHYLLARIFRLRSMARALEEASLTEEGYQWITETAAEFFQLQASLLQDLAVMGVEAADDAPKVRELEGLAARARLLGAEVQVIDAIDRSERALEALNSFEQRHPDLGHLIGRVWRTRLLALEKLGRISEAEEAIPRFIEADRKFAGPVLQKLFREVYDALEANVLAGREVAGERARLALVLARAIYSWSESADPSVGPDRLRLLRLQLADAYLIAGDPEQALATYRECGADVEVGDDDQLDVPMEMGVAEALYDLGRFEQALPRFNRLATRLDRDDSRRIRALLRDLQCRTELNQPPEGIIKVIEQQKYLHKSIEDSPLANEFDRVLRENQRRRDSR